MSTVFEQLKARQEQAAPEGGTPPSGSQEPIITPSQTPPGNDGGADPGEQPTAPITSTASKSDDINDEVRSQLQATFLSNIFGEEAKSIDDAKTHISTLRNEVDSYKGKVSEYEKQLQEKIDPFANEKVKRYNQYAKKSGNDDFRVFNLIESMNEDMAESNPLDVVVAGRVLDNPSSAGKESIIREIILEELGLEPDADLSELNDKQKLRLDAMAHQAVRSIREKKESLIGETEPSQTIEEVQAKRQAAQDESRTKWSPVVESVLPSLSKYVLGKGDDAFIFEFDATRLSEYGKLATDYLVKNGKEFTEESVKEAAQLIRNGLIVENFDTIMAAHATYARNLNQEQYDKKYSNPSALDPKITDPKGPTPDPPIESSQNQMLDFQKMKRREQMYNS